MGTVGEPRPLVEKAAVRAALGDSGVVLANALSAEQHAGRGGVTYGRPERIPGSVSLPARSLTDPVTRAFLPPDRLRAGFEAAGVGPVLDLLLTDESNPRSVAFQLANCAVYFEQLPRDANGEEESPEKQLVTSLLNMLRQVDNQALAKKYVLGDTEQLDWLFMKLETTLPRLSDSVSHRYLIHVGPTQRLAEIGDVDTPQPKEFAD